MAREKLLKKSSIAENYIFSIVYNILSIIVPLITAPYIARVLEPDGVGIYSLTSNNVSYFVAFGVLGLGTYGQLEIAKVMDDVYQTSKIFFEISIVRIVTHAICIIVFCILLLFIEQYQVMYFIQGAILLSSMLDVTWFFQGVEEFKKIAIRNILIKVISVIFIFALVKSKHDLVIYTIIMLASSFISSICLIPLLRNYLIKINLKTLHFKPHVKGAFMFFIPTIASVIGSSVDKTMIDIICDVPEENGWYAQAYKMQILCFTLFSALNQVMRSRMAYLFSNEKKDDIKRLVHKSLKFIVFLAFPIAFGMAGMAYSFVPWFLGTGYEKVSVLMIIFAGWMIFKPISNCVLEQDIMASGRQKVFNIIIWVGAISNVFFNIILIPFFSSVGAAVASVFSELIIFIITIFKSSENFVFRDLVESSWNKLFSSVVMVSVMYLIGYCIEIPIFTTVLQGILGATTYIAVLLFFNDKVCKDLINMILKKCVGKV